MLVDFYAESAQDGSLIAETYSSEPRAYLLSADALGPDLYNALHGQHVGARILQVAPGPRGVPGCRRGLRHPADPRHRGGRSVA